MSNQTDSSAVRSQISSVAPNGALQEETISIDHPMVSPSPQRTTSYLLYQAPKPDESGCNQSTIVAAARNLAVPAVHGIFIPEAKHHIFLEAAASFVEGWAENKKTVLEDEPVLVTRELDVLGSKVCSGAKLCADVKSGRLGELKNRFGDRRLYSQMQSAADDAARIMAQKLNLVSDEHRVVLVIAEPIAIGLIAHRLCGECGAANRVFSADFGTDRLVNLTVKEGYHWLKRGVRATIASIHLPTLVQNASFKVGSVGGLGDLCSPCG